MESRFASFREFYPFYLGEHAKPLTRLLHVVGLALVIVWFFYCVLSSQTTLLWWAPVIGYGFAWVGHFFVERNRPATFQYPLYSLRGDFQLFYDVLRTRKLLFERSSAS